MRGSSGRTRALRRRVYVLIALQLLVPALLLGVRLTDPGLGQLRFGWQMHTSCWGEEPPCPSP